MTKRDYQAAECAAECGAINTQVRNVNGLGYWTDYGSYGWIEAAQMHAGSCGLGTGQQVEVRDSNDPTRPPAIFTVKRVVTYEIMNPRQGE